MSKVYRSGDVVRVAQDGRIHQITHVCLEADCYVVDGEVYHASLLTTVPAATPGRVLCSECSLDDEGQLIRDFAASDTYAVRPDTGGQSRRRSWCRGCYEKLTARRCRVGGQSGKKRPEELDESDNPSLDNAVKVAEAAQEGI